MRGLFAGSDAIKYLAAFPGGDRFSGPEELRTLLLKRGEFFVRTVTSRLLSHALGRRIEALDRPAVDKIVVSLKDNDYRLADLIIAVSASDLFQRRSSEWVETILLAPFSEPRQSSIRFHKTRSANASGSGLCLEVFAVAPALTNRFLHECVQLWMIGDAASVGIPLDASVETLGQDTQQNDLGQSCGVVEV